jgi:hypothetical protein
MCACAMCHTYCVCTCMSRVGQIHIYSVYAAVLAGGSPIKLSYTVYTYTVWPTLCMSESEWECFGIARKMAHTLVVQRTPIHCKCVHTHTHTNTHTPAAACCCCCATSTSWASKASCCSMKGSSCGFGYSGPETNRPSSQQRPCARV